MASAPVVAIFNTNDDVVEMLRIVIEQAGLVAVSGHIDKIRRGEMNLRAFEVPACGAMLMMESSNLEVRECFVPGHEVVLYGDDDLEEQVMRPTTAAGGFSTTSAMRPA